MSHRVSLRQLKISYFISVFVIIALLMITQVIIQLTLRQDIHVRSLTQQVNAQELRTERMFYNIILLQNPPGHGVDYAGLTQEIESDVPAWEAFQNALYTGNFALGISLSDFSSVEQAAIGDAKPKYISMDLALHRVLLAEKTQNDSTPDKVRNDVDIFYLGESAYLQSLVTIYTNLVAETDAQVIHIQLAEISLFTLSILTVLAEYLFVVRPGTKSVQDAFGKLQEAIEKIEDAR